MKMNKVVLLAGVLISGIGAFAAPQAVLCDPLEWLYDDSKPADVKPYAATDVPANGVAEANVLAVGLDPAQPVEVSSDAPSAEWYRLVPVAVEKNTGLYGSATYPSALTNLWVTRPAPFRVCDAMEPVADGRVAPDSPTMALRFRLSGFSAAGRQRVRLTVRQGGFRAELPFDVNVHDVKLPAVGAKSYKYVNWINYDSIAACHGLEPWSDAHYAMIERYARLAVRSRQTMATVPLFLTTNGVPEEAKLVRLVRTLDRAGIAWFLGGHFCGFYQGRWHVSPLAVKGCEWPVTTPAGALKLAEAAAGLNRVLDRNGLKGRWYQHVVDEPSPQHVSDYRAACAIVRKNLPNVRLFDATETTDIAGVLDAYCPKSYVYEEWQGRHNVMKTSPKDEMWCYTCCFPGGRWMNRLLDKDPIQSVLLPWGCRLFGLDGYLHWGYNQFKPANDPLKRRIGDEVLKGEDLPPGDRNVVYAGKDGPWPSVRLEAMRLGMEDAELWKTLADSDRPAADALMHRLVRGFGDYETDHAKYRAVRRELLEAVSK